MPRKSVKVIEIQVEKKQPQPEPELWIESVRSDATQEVLDLESLQLQDITNKIENREMLKEFLIKLLVIQNIAVFSLVVGALVFGKMQELQLVFSVLIAGTLAETSSMVFFMVKWLFSDIKYQKIK